MTKLYTLLILLTACGSVEDGAVSINVSPAPTTNEEETQNLPLPTSEVDYEVSVIDEENQELDTEIDASPSPTPSPAVDPIDYELMSDKKTAYDVLFQARIDSLFTWDLGQDWTLKADRMDYTFTQGKDYSADDIGVFATPEENAAWRKWITPSQGHTQKRICGEVEYSSLTFSELLIHYADDTTALIRIEIAFDETNFEVGGDPLPIKYMKLTLKKSTDAVAQAWTNSHCP